MNQRIKLLAADAGYPDYMTYGQDKVLERFAELIVKECIAAHVDDYGGDIIGDVLKNHFGIEE